MSNFMLLFIITAVFAIIVIVLTILLFKSIRSFSGGKSNVAQQKDDEKNCVYLPLDLNASVLFEFKKACAENNTTHTAEIERFIVTYCKEHGKDE